MFFFPLNWSYSLPIKQEICLSSTATHLATGKPLHPKQTQQNSSINGLRIPISTMQKNICEPLTLITWEIWFQNTIFKLKQKMHRYISTILTWTPPLRLKSNCKLIQVPLQGSYQMENDCKIHTRQHHQQLKHQTDKGILQNKGTLISREHFQTWKRIVKRDVKSLRLSISWFSHKMSYWKTSRCRIFSSTKM